MVSQSDAFSAQFPPYSSKNAIMDQRSLCRSGLLKKFKNSKAATAEGFAESWSAKEIGEHLRELFPDVFRWQDKFGEVGENQEGWCPLVKNRQRLESIEAGADGVTGNELKRFAGSTSGRAWDDIYLTFGESNKMIKTYLQY